AQTTDTQQSTASARAFMDNQVTQARAALSEVDKQILDFKSTHVGILPSETDGLFNQLSGLREEQKALIAEVGRLQDRRSAATTNLTTIKSARAQAIEDAATN